MTDDLLKAATRALRDEGEPRTDGHLTRARVMASLHQGTLRRRTRLAFMLPVAACLAAGTAWGTATGRLPAAFRALGEIVSPSAKPAPARSAPAPVTAVKPSLPARPGVEPAPAAVEAPVVPEVKPTASVETPVAAPATEAKPAASVAAPAVEAKPASTPAATPAAPPASAPARPATSASATFHDPDGDLYRLAHEAHFVQHDDARALSAWEAYLRAAPGGRLATEARYNRALCLLRLGRDAEARHALAPFAAGKMGYRQNEARQLLDALAAP